MNEDLLRFNNQQKYLVFDFETCNLNLCSTDNKPWQLAFLVCQGNKVLEEYDYYIYWEDLKISKDAKKITGFSDKKYKDRAQPAEFVLEHFEKLLYDKDYIPVGHNIFGFDIYIHNIFRKCLGKKTDYSYLDRSIDTLCLAKAMHKESHYSQDQNFFCWQMKFNNFRQRGVKLNLGACCTNHDIDFDPSKLHDALYDITQNYKLLKKMLWKIDI